MENKFVAYELAVKLKELGFDDNCFARYRKGIFQYNTLGKPISHNSDQIVSGDVSAPLWQQAFDWFFNTQNLFQYIRVFNKRDFGFSVFTMYEDMGKALVYSSNYYETYEEARQACLEKLIQLAQGD